jgi:hypothetical protein
MKSLSLISSKPGGYLAKSGSEYSEKTLNLVSQGMNNPIRNLDYPEEYVTIQIQKIAEQYGTREKISDHVLGECVGIVLSRFGMLGLDELSEAFRMAAVGDLGKVNMTAYAGMFHAGIVGSVLGLYREHRRKVSKSIISNGQVKIDVRDEDRQKEFDRQFPRLLEKGKAEYKNWDAVPEYWFRVGERMGLFGLVEEEKELLYWEAVDLARDGLHYDLDNNARSFQRQEIIDELFLLERGICTPAVGRVYRKLVVFVKLVNID